MSSSVKKKIAVLGAGITGLTAAWKLTREGYAVTLFEKSPRGGGAIQTTTNDGWLVEHGPNTFQENDPAVRELIRELGLEGEKIYANLEAKNRYVIHKGRVIALPFSPPNLIASPLFSIGTKLRIFREVFRKPNARLADLSFADLIRDHVGSEVLDYLVQPFVSGTYAGDAEKLSAQYAFPKIWAYEKSNGSLLKGQIAAARKRREQGEPPSPPLFSFKAGLQTLTNALVLALPTASTQFFTEIEALHYDQTWRVYGQRRGENFTAEFDAVVTALPAGGLAHLRISDEQPFARLSSIYHPPVTSLFLGFKRDQVTHPLDGFGVLAPRVEQRKILGAIFCSTLFPHRAPEGHVALNVFVGGALQPEMTGLPRDALLNQVMEELRPLLGISGDPAFTQITAWPQAIPQYNLGYQTHLQAIEDAEQRYPKLYVGGQVRDGIALGNCVLSGLRLASAAGA